MKKIDIVVGAATSRLTGDACQPYASTGPTTPTHSRSARRALVEAGGDSWFFLTPTTPSAMR